MAWRDELLSVAKELRMFAGDTPFDPLWVACPCCGVQHEASKGCGNYWTCHSIGGVQCDPPPSL